MAHNTRIKPQAGDSIGLTALYSKIGTDLGNCRVLATRFTYNWGSDQVQFEARYMYNNTAADAWLANNESVNPIRVDEIAITGIDLDKSIIDQCLDHLLTLPQFNGSQDGTLPWVKT
jgi:hypothetical protein